ncbi:NAD(P)/FAD-dependent oxidoreductase [Actinacidiphila glaucinigra]|uniref:NAD(P)/FAD-dependent oxidoreductase n=1 Tax=Actinacidiphila glaucinigra TaxID=235986 RepID=UPI0035D6DC68
MTPVGTEVDIAVVGAGPAGLFAAYYAGFRGLSVAVIDSLPEPGGQISAMYPEKDILDVAGFPAVRGRELVDRLVAQAAPYKPAYLLGQPAERLEAVGTPGRGGRFVIANSTGLSVRAGAVVITGGIGTFRPRPLPAAADFSGEGIAHFVRDPGEYDAADVVIVGGGDSAFDWADMLSDRARTVTLVHRRTAFRAHAGTIERVRAAGVGVIAPAELITLRGGDRLEAVEIRSADGAFDVPCQKVIAALGFTANLGPLLGWGIDIRDRRHIPVDTAMQTNIPGVFAAGDINDYPGKVRLIAVGFGEAATAVNNAAHFLDPRQPVFPGHSTDAAAAA